MKKEPKLLELKGKSGEIYFPKFYPLSEYHVDVFPVVYVLTRILESGAHRAVFVGNAKSIEHLMFIEGNTMTSYIELSGATHIGFLNSNNIDFVETDIRNYYYDMLPLDIFRQILQGEQPYK